ncbi:MAG: glycosyltransferase family 4 protein [Anaerolineales bacterium]|jgi:glycosyltransferase involved in cell wall biosynthesis
MHILLIHQAFAALDEPGGTRHHEIAQYLVKRGHCVTIIASPVSYLTGKSGDQIAAEEQQAGIRILRAYTYSALHRSFVHRIFSFLSFMVSSFITGYKVKNVDLVWGTSPPIFQSLTAWALARIKGTPFLLEIRDLWPAFAIAVGVLRQPQLIAASEWLEKFLYQHADQVVVNSPGFIDHVRDHGAKNVVLIPNGADTRMFDPHAPGDIGHHSIDIPGKFIALYAGAHGLSNDLGVLLQAAAILKNRSEIFFVLLGDGKDKPALQKQAQDLALPNLKFLPPLPKNEMPAALAAADACIAILKPIPIYGTVYPNKVFDYMAAGKPVLLAMQGVIREVVEAAGAGLVIPPGDPPALAEGITYLAEHQDEGFTMGTRGRSYVKKYFDRPDQAEKFARLIDDLVDFDKV